LTLFQMFASWFESWFPSDWFMEGGYLLVAPIIIMVWRLLTRRRENE